MANPFKNNKITPMVKLILHEPASKALHYDLYYTEKDMYFEVKDDKDRIFLFVPRGFLTDGSSVPKLLQPLFPVWDDYYQAAIFHDCLCEYLTIYVNGKPTKITREECDRYFLMIMEFLNINKIKRNLIIHGVRIYATIMSLSDPSASLTKRFWEDKIREDMKIAGRAREDQKKK